MLDNQTINRPSGADILHVILSNENMTAATLSNKLGYSSPQQHIEGDNKRDIARLIE